MSYIANKFKFLRGISMNNPGDLVQPSAITPFFAENQTINRKEAKSRWSQLTPGCEEQTRLGHALKHTSGIYEIVNSHSCYKVNVTPEHHHCKGGFGSSEHVAIGEAISLKGLSKDEPLMVKGITHVTFADIVALAGDFYGIPGKAISLPGGTDNDKKQRFMDSFNTLAQKGNEDQVRKIIHEIRQECNAVKHSCLPHHCYSEQMIAKNKAIKKIKGDIEALLIDNSDHFSSNAEDAYRIGHTLAIEKGIEAGKTGDLEGLKQAYALDAFACHFLTDLFAAGHVRNQRGALETFLVKKLGFFPSEAKQLSGLLTGAQHQKDGDEGLNVANKRNQYWRAYGDGSFFSPKNAKNKEQVIKATQESVDEVFVAFENPYTSTPSSVSDLIPYPTSFNPPPLYSIEGESFYFFHGSDKVEITSRDQYFNQSIPLALSYLPESYVAGYLVGRIDKMPPVLEKVVLPLVQRMTGTVWRLVGVATYHQIDRSSNQLKEQITEMAGIVHENHELTVQILKKLEEFNTKLNFLIWNKKIFQEIEAAISTIQDIFHEQKTYNGDLLTNQRQQEVENDLWKSLMRLSRVFTEGTRDNQHLLTLFASMLRDTTSMSLEEITAASTLWFRQMIEYQIQAFGLYQSLQIREGAEILQRRQSKFENSLLDQIMQNEGVIDPELIYENPHYIALQIEKLKTSRTSCTLFITN